MLTLICWSMPAALAAVPGILPDPDNQPPNKKKPIKVYFLSGQSNMVGMGQPATLKPLAEGDEKFGYLIDDQGNWTVRNDVHYVNYVMDDLKNNQALTVHGRFGPEVGIGHVLGHYHDEMVLLIKACTGNRSLHWDFCPPSARDRQNLHAEIEQMKSEGKWYWGKSYDRYVGHAQNVLANIEDYVPGYEGQGYEMAGFFWWQGHKDKGKSKEEYQQLLGELIQDFRKDFNAPDAPFVVATVAFNGFNLGPWQGVWEAQMAISEEDRFKGNVASVDIRDIGGGGFHYGDNGAIYGKVGDRMGRAMAQLHEQSGGRSSSSRSSRFSSDDTPMPEGLSVDDAPSELRGVMSGLSQRKYAATMRLLDIAERKDDDKALSEQITTIRTFINEQADAAVEEIQTYMAHGNPYKAQELITQTMRYYRGLDNYDQAVNEINKELRERETRVAIRQGGQFYQLIDNLAEDRSDRNIELLKRFAEISGGDTVYSQAAQKVLAALNNDEAIDLDADKLVAELSQKAQ